MGVGSRIVGVAAVALAVGLLTPGAVHAQDWSWPERAENLTELPADFPPERLSAVMRGFTQALGVRCSHCHVGTEGASLATYDFVSDANPNKDRARAMYRMLGVINDHLDEIEPSGESVNMWCHTCHAGKPRPQTLAEAVREEHGRSGGDAAYELFVALRERSYGAAAYDFTAGSVNGVALEIAELGDTVTAYRFLEHNTAVYSGDALAQEGVGDAYLSVGDTARAIVSFERALVIAPANRRVSAKLGRLRVP